MGMTAAGVEDHRDLIASAATRGDTAVPRSCPRYHRLTISELLSRISIFARNLSASRALSFSIVTSVPEGGCALQDVRQRIHSSRGRALSMKRFLFGLVALALVISVASQAMAQPSYLYTTFDVPGATDTFALGINDSGLIVGYYLLDTGGPVSEVHGFMLDDQGNYTTLDAPGAALTVAIGINASGQIVGAYGYADLTDHGFLLDDQGSYTTLDAPGSTYSEAYGINASGQIVGYYLDVAFNRHGFLLDSGSYTTLDVPGTNLTEAFGINASGQIVGIHDDEHGFLLDQGSYTTLDVSGAIRTEANGINDLGQIVGRYYVGPQAFLLDQGSYTTLNVFGAMSASASGINNSGQIVGFYLDGNGTHGFLDTPVP
jgi:uncharacterized membrane protein